MTRTQLVKDLDKMLGLQSVPPQQMQAPVATDPPCNWSVGWCLEDIPSEGRTWTVGRKRFVEATRDGGFLYIPGRPAYANSTTVGQVDSRGNIYATTTTSETPGTQSGGFYVHWRTILYVGTDGKSYRWEIQQCVSGAPRLSDDTVPYMTPGYTIHTPWEVVASKELRQDKKGAPKIVTIQKPTAAWFMR
jgi:hypothetical protein